MKATVLLISLFGLTVAAGAQMRTVHVDAAKVTGFIRSLQGVNQASMENAAFSGAALINAQDSPLDRSLYYRGDAGSMGFFETNGNYRKRAYVFKALGAMLDTRQRLAATGGDTYGFGVLAGRSADGGTAQVFICNYEIPQVFRAAPDPRMANFTQLPRREDIQYRDNGGYALSIDNLPWGKGEFSVARYRVSRTEDYALAGETSGKGGTLRMSNPLAPPAAELIVLRRK